MVAALAEVVGAAEVAAAVTMWAAPRRRTVEAAAKPSPERVGPGVAPAEATAVLLLLL